MPICLAMAFLPPILAALSMLVLAAHFLRHGAVPLVIAVLIIIPIAFTPKRWAVRITQVCLLGAAIEWVATALNIMHERQAADEPYIRMLVILGSVAAVALLAAGLYQVPAARRRYLQTKAPQAD